jgi:hypothetical protein
MVLQTVFATHQCSERRHAVDKTEALVREIVSAATMISKLSPQSRERLMYIAEGAAMAEGVVRKEAEKTA